MSAGQRGCWCPRSDARGIRTEQLDGSCQPGMMALDRGATWRGTIQVKQETQQLCNDKYLQGYEHQFN